MTKKGLFILALLLCIYFLPSATPRYNGKPHPIPSRNFIMTGSDAFLDYNSNPPLRERRDLLVQTSTASPKGRPYRTKVYVFKKDTQIVKGPFYVDDGEILVVPVDYGTWGATITSNTEISVNIWFSPH